MKKVLLFLFVGGFFSAQNVEFTDINFKNAIIKAYPAVDANKDHEISFEEAKTLTSIRNLSSYPLITNVKGIESFTNLIELSLTQKDFTTIDVSKNTKLTTLNLRENKLAGTLDVSSLSALKTLELNSNALAEVVLPVNGNIETLYINENKLTEIDIKTLPNLKRLFLVNNQITVLDLSQNTTLERLHIDKNKVTNLDLTNLTKLNWMSVNDNLLTNITFRNNPVLKTILAQNNNIETLNFQDGFTNGLTLINLTGNATFSKIIKDCNDTLPSNVSVPIQDNCILGTKSEILNSVKFYPNPVTDQIYFSENLEIENYQILNVEGKVVRSENALDVKSLEVSTLEKGFYLLKLQTKKGELVHRFIKN